MPNGGAEKDRTDIQYPHHVLSCWWCVVICVFPGSTKDLRLRYWNEILREREISEAFLDTLVIELDLSTVQSICASNIEFETDSRQKN